LINDNASLFAINDFVAHRQTTFNLRNSSIKRSIKRLLPRLGRNIKGKRNYQELARLLLSQSPAPRVLVIGGSILGDGMESLAGDSRIELVETDVAFGPRTQLISDAHDIPFASAVFDAVVVQAVLQYLVEPARSVDEIHRVLKPGGLVYAESAFMQQVVLGRYDFARFTHLGHRRLFRRFEEVDSGVVCGPGMALAWSFQFFLLSFARSKLVRGIMRALCQLSLFWIKYFDYHLVNKPGAFDAASGFYFLGKKSERILSDRDLIQLYRGPT
jgi:SAM-dependent methyltransferase